MNSLIPTEFILDSIQISPDQFMDCAQALIHTILFHRAIDTQVTPKSIHMTGVDIAYASAETEEVTQYIASRLAPLQDAIFEDPKKECWLVLSLAFNIPKKGWFRDTYSTEIWERWCISFSFATLTAQEIREKLLHTITQITNKANASEIPKIPSSDASFKFTLSLPTDKDSDVSTELKKLIGKIVHTPTSMFA
ncbi:hypothetical protein TRFO_02245 [Tritrichomonas foetus]|uniref:Autophagy-related protein 101 n=1 Tax=Tritrichomonas foetus TaxID=1144522 RepID=A0A1J4JC81_9EUKA|nr:hypothetical protein TRFO_02245 [Tritrichomonas foetus]|eukprot:OHS95259.1 hypothetical protein TRFO_02245 [Tritrichomonas foetus]